MFCSILENMSSSAAVSTISDAEDSSDSEWEEDFHESFQSMLIFLVI